MPGFFLSRISAAIASVISSESGSPRSVTIPRRSPSASWAKPMAARPAFTTAQSWAIVSGFGSGACGKGALGSSLTARTSHPNVASHFGLRNEQAPLQQSTATVSLRALIVSAAKLSSSTLMCSSIGFAVCNSLLDRVPRRLLQTHPGERCRAALHPASN